MYHFSPLKSAKIQKFDNIEKIVGGQALSIVAGGNVNWYDPTEGNLEIALKNTNVYILWPSNFTPGNLPYRYTDQNDTCTWLITVHDSKRSEKCPCIGDNCIYIIYIYIIYIIYIIFIYGCVYVYTYIYNFFLTKEKISRNSGRVNKKPRTMVANWRWGGIWGTEDKRQEAEFILYTFEYFLSFKSY